MKARIIMMLAVSITAIQIQAQTFHFISMFDTNDAKIGTGMKTERNLINNEMQTIAGYLEEFGYDCVMDDYYGVNCGRAPLMQAINGLQVGSNDVVVFYYGGHGARAYNNSSDRFPQMCLGERSESNWVPSTLIKNMIVKKHPRLTVILTGCCNKEGQGVTIKSVVAQSSGYTSQANVDKEAFKKLFLETTGVVQFTSSRAGEYSYCIDEGSFFALALLDVLNAVGKGQVQPNWNSVCQTAKEMVSSLDMNGTRQHPDYEVNTNVGGSTPKNDDATITRRVNDTDYDLSQDIARLHDKSQSTESRLALVPTILERHFASGAKVMTLGRDMTTVVDYEDATTFLRRIAMSPYISQINIVEQQTGKNQLIRVHEVRTR